MLENLAHSAVAKQNMQSLSEEECNQLEATSVAVKQRRQGVTKLEHRHRAQSIIQSKALDELETEVLETGLYENVDLGRGSRGSVVAAEIIYSELDHRFCPLLYCEICDERCMSTSIATLTHSLKLTSAGDQEQILPYSAGYTKGRILIHGYY